MILTSIEAATSLIPSAFFTGIGSWLVSTWLNTLLEGVLLQQTVRYFQLYRSDPLYLKIWVAVTVASQTTSLVLSMHTAYFYLVTNYFNPAVVLAGAVISAKVLPFTGALTNLAVELFYVRRVYMVGVRYRVFAIISLLLVLIGVAFLIVLGVEPFRINNLTKDTSMGGLGGSSVASPAFMLAADIQLTGVLIYALHTSRSGLARTNSMINMLILYAVSTGFLICVFNLAALILAAVFPHSVLFTAAMNVGGQGDVPSVLQHTGPSSIFIPVYSNSFIIALNTRRLVQKRGEMPTTAMVPSTSIMFQGSPGSGTAIAEMELQSMAFAPGAAASAHAKETVTMDSPAVLDFKVISNAESDSQGENRSEKGHHSSV